MKIIKSLIICILIISAPGCKNRTDCTGLFSAIKSSFESGNFGDIRLLTDSLKNNCQDEKLFLKADSLLGISERIRLDFPLTEEQFLSKAVKYFGNVTDSMMSEWNSNKWIEWRMIDGEKRYFNRSFSNIVLLKSFYEENEKQVRETAADPEMVLRLKHTAEVIKQSGNKTNPVIPVEMKITYTITVQPDAVPGGEKIRCWMPLPKENHLRQRKFELLKTSVPDYIIAPDSAVHRTIYMEEASVKGTPTLFSVSYRYTSSAQYFDLRNLKIPPYDKTSAIYKKFTREQLPQICFTEKIKKLADDITDPSDDPQTIVRKIYLWFKENIPWTGALEYSIMPNIPEYVYDNRRGDCGMQTLLFMSMLRYKGIPVRWQSGWKVPPDYKNLHDWCEVWYEGLGWVPADVSYDLQSSENNQLLEFFMSGIDSYRLIVNDGIAGPLYPEKNYLRSEPYDFQRGEVEWKGGNLYFDKWDYHMQIEYPK